MVLLTAIIVTTHSNPYSPVSYKYPTVFLTFVFPIFSTLGLFILNGKVFSFHSWGILHLDYCGNRIRAFVVDVNFSFLTVLISIE